VEKASGNRIGAENAMKARPAVIAWSGVVKMSTQTLGTFHVIRIWSPEQIAPWTLYRIRYVSAPGNSVQ